MIRLGDSQSSDNISDDGQYHRIKRVRQACRNCRRKKARCAGERPQCSFCVRLGQPCSYSGDEAVDDVNGINGSVHSNTKRTSQQQLRRWSTTQAETYPDTKTIASQMAALEDQVASMTRTISGLQYALDNFTAQMAKVMATASPPLQAGPLNSDIPLEVNNGLSSTMPSSYSRLPPIGVIRNAVNLYFRYCHNQPYSLFHEASLRSRIELNEVPAHLLFALLASTVRYSSEPFFTDKTAATWSFASLSWKAIVLPWDGLQSDAELSIVQTFLLLAIIDYVDGRTQASWIKVGLAIRLCQDFRLMVEPDPKLSVIQQEERRRVFWSFYLCDKLVSCGRERPPTVLDDQCRLRLPCGENEFRAGIYQEMPTLEQVLDDNNSTGFVVASTSSSSSNNNNNNSSSPSLSPFAVSVVVASLLGRCAQYALNQQEESSQNGRLPPWSPRSRYAAIHSTMLHVESELGLNCPVASKITTSCCTNTDDNNNDPTAGGGLSLDQHRAAPLAFAHALFYLCECLLYHPFLLRRRLAALGIGQRTPQSFLAQTVSACRHAATALSQLVGEVKSLGCETLTTLYDPFYGYCNMVAGVLHAMHLGPTTTTTNSDGGSNTTAMSPVDEQRASALAAFEVSRGNLEELAFYWKSCSMMHARLNEFRENCGRYHMLVDPTVLDDEVRLSADDVNDLLECLDYARMSTTPRRLSQSGKHGYKFGNTMNGKGGMDGGSGGVGGDGRGSSGSGGGVDETMGDEQIWQSMSAGGPQALTTISPFFDEFVNLLPLPGTGSRAVSPRGTGCEPAGFPS